MYMNTQSKSLSGSCGLLHGPRHLVWCILTSCRMPLILPSTPQPTSNILHLPLRFDKDYCLVSPLLRHLIEQLAQPTENRERGMQRKNVTSRICKLCFPLGALNLRLFGFRILQKLPRLLIAMALALQGQEFPKYTPKLTLKTDKQVKGVQEAKYARCPKGLRQLQVEECHLDPQDLSYKCIFLYPSRLIRLVKSSTFLFVSANTMILLSFSAMISSSSCRSLWDKAHK